VFYPLSTLPAWMQWVGYVLPPSYVFEDLRATFAGQPSGAWSSQLLAASLALVHVVVAGWLFSRVYRKAVRSGLLARYSAESVS
jgi:ABC-2 type transport system permease protein